MPSARVLPTLAVLALLGAAPSHAAAQAIATGGRRFLVENEPLLLTQRGASVTLARALGEESRWAAGLSVHATDMPEGVRDLFFRDAEGLEMRLAWAVGVDVRRRLSGERNGWFAGVGAGLESFRARVDGTSDARENVFVAPHLGYVWYPRAGRFFVYPRATLIALVDDDRARDIAGRRYELRPAAPNLQLRTGFTF